MARAGLVSIRRALGRHYLDRTGSEAHCVAALVREHAHITRARDDREAEIATLKREVKALRTLNNAYRRGSRAGLTKALNTLKEIRDARES